MQCVRARASVLSQTRASVLRLRACPAAAGYYYLLLLLLLLIYLCIVRLVLCSADTRVQAPIYTSPLALFSRLCSLIIYQTKKKKKVTQVTARDQASCVATCEKRAYIYIYMLVIARVYKKYLYISTTQESDRRRKIKVREECDKQSRPVVFPFVSPIVYLSDNGALFDKFLLSRI